MPPVTPTQATAPVQMTRAQYQAKYGAPPPVQGASKPVSPVSSPTSAPIKMTRAEYQSKYGVAPSTTTSSTPSATPDQGGGIGGFVSGLVKAPATILARPIQAIAELAGAKSEDVDRVTKNLTGGLVAPVPQNGADVEKDVGRGAQTVALGLGPVSGGALFGAGNSLEQGNDLLSTQTAFQTVLGAGVGKVLDLVGKPILDAAGKVVGTITPQTLKDVASKGAQAIADFAAQHEILPKAASDAINAGAKTAETVANKPFQVAGNALRTTATAGKDLIQSEYPGLSINEQKFNQAKENIAREYKKTLPLTPTEQAKEVTLRDRTGDNVYTTIAKHGTDPERLQQISDQYENATNYAKQNETMHFNIDDIRKNAESSIDRNLSSETERDTAKKQVGDEIDTLLSKNKDKIYQGANGEQRISVDLQERLRKTGNDWAQYNKFNPNTVKNASGRALADAVRDQVEKEGTFPAYREANKEWGKIIHAQEVLGKLDASGKTFKSPGGLSGSISRKILSGVLGYHVGGAGGAVLGELGSEYGNKILSNPELRTYFDRKVVEKFAGKNPTPEAITTLTQQVKDFIDNQASLKQLPAPSSIQLGPRTSSSGVVTPRPVSPDELLAAQKATGTVQKPLQIEAKGKNVIRLPKPRKS